MKKQKTIIPPKRKPKEPIVVDLNDFKNVLKQVVTTPSIREK